MKVLLIWGAIPVLLIAMIAALIISGSGSDNPTTESEKAVGGTIQTISHAGHLFVIWDGYNAGGIIHSPACSCIKGGSQ